MSEFIFDIVFEYHTELLTAADWTCSADQRRCDCRAVTFVATPIFYTAVRDQPSTIISTCTVPICGDPVCDTIAKRETANLVKEIADENGSLRIFRGGQQALR